MGRKGWLGGLNDWDEEEAALETAKRVARAYSTAPCRVAPLVLVRSRIGPFPLRPSPPLHHSCIVLDSPLQFTLHQYKVLTFLWTTVYFK